MLQSERTTVSDARALFDAVIDKYPDAVHRLGSSPAIVHSPEFESSLIKIQRDNTGRPSRKESRAGSNLHMFRESTK